MNSYITLTKVFFLTGFSVNKKKNSQKPIFNQLLLMGIILSVVSILYNAMLFLTTDIQQQDYRDILIFVLTISGFLVFINTFNQMQTTLFDSNDFEFIQSLPVKDSVVVAAKISSLLLICIAEDIIVFLPTTILYFVFSHDVFGTIISFITMFLISFAPLLASAIVGTLIALITKRLKKKNIFQIIVYLMYFLVVFTISFSLNNSNMVDRSALSKVFPHLIFFKEAIYTQSILPFLIFVGINIGAFILVVALISLLYKPINSIKQNIGNGKYKLEKNTNSSVSSLLLKKEWKMLVSKANYFINSIFGCIMYPVTVVLLFLIGIPENAKIEFYGYVMLFIPFMGMIMNSIANTGSATFSFERKNFELLLSYPISPKEIIKSKLLISFVVPAVLDLIASSAIIVILAVKGLLVYATWPLIVSIYIAPLFALLYTSFVAVLCNLKLPKLDYETDIQVIKNSRSVIFTMLLATIPTLVFGGIVIALNLFSTLLSLISLIVVFSILIIVAYFILKKNGEVWFRDIINK